MYILQYLCAGSLFSVVCIKIWPKMNGNVIGLLVYCLFCVVILVLLQYVNEFCLYYVMNALFFVVYVISV